MYYEPLSVIFILMLSSIIAVFRNQNGVHSSVIPRIAQSLQWLDVGRQPVFDSRQGIRKSHYHCVQTQPGAHAATRPAGTGGWSDRSIQLTTNLHIELRLWVRGAMPPFFHTSRYECYSCLDTPFGVGWPYDGGRLRRDEILFHS